MEEKVPLNPSLLPPAAKIAPDEVAKYQHIFEYLRQLFCLLRKNLYISRGACSSLFIIILSPGIAILTIALISLLVNTVTDDLEVLVIPEVLGCSEESDLPCYLFSPNTDEQVITIMEEFCDLTGLVLGVDVQGMETERAAVEYIVEHLQTQTTEVRALLYFNNSVEEMQRSSSTSKPYTTWQSQKYTSNSTSSSSSTSSSTAFDDLNVHYGIWFNSSKSGEYLSVSQEIPSNPMALQLTLDQAVTHYYTNRNASATGSTTTVNVKASMTGWNTGILPFQESVGHSLTVIYGLPLALSLGIVMFGLTVMALVMEERYNKLLGLMRSMGLHESIYWLSWLFSSACLGIISVLVAILVGYTADLLVFNNTSLSIWFVLIFASCIAQSSFVLALAACWTTPKAVRSLSAGLMFVALIENTVILAYPNSYYDVYLSSGWAFFFGLQPWFHLGKLVKDVIQLTSQDPDTGDMLLFTWDKLDTTPSAFSDPTQGPVPPTPHDSLISLWWLTVLYLALAWYLAQVRDTGDGTGSAASYSFPLSLEYWGYRAVTAVEQGDTVARLQALSRQEQSIRTHKLSKAYNDIQAVKEVSLDVQRGTLFALLGHNGAGKSSLVKLLSGATTPTHGEAFVLGYSLKSDAAELKKHCGVCAQEDILWDALTARQHLELYGALRGLDSAALPDMLHGRLELFGISEMIDKPVASMSGGMKRRLSCSLATLGSPSIVFLDEPTTGMDPLARHKVWKAIEAIKNDSLVILTTHDMEEADFLGDVVGIMAQGQMTLFNDPNDPNHNPIYLNSLVDDSECTLIR